MNIKYLAQVSALIVTAFLTACANTGKQSTPMPESAHFSTTLIVAPTGSDKTGTGTLEHPFATISGAATKAQPGTQILLRGGRYLKTKNQVTLIGHEDAPIRIAPYNDEKPILDGRGNGVHPAIEDEKNKHEIVSALDLRKSRFVIVENLEVDGSEGFGVSLWDSEHITIRGCRIHDTWSRALGGSGAHILYEGNEIWNAVLLNKNEKVLKDRARGIMSYYACASDTWFREDGSPSEDVTWRGNRVRDSWGEGIDANHVVGAVIEDNIVADTYSVLIYVDHSKNVIVRGNRLTGTSDTYIRRDTKDRPVGVLISTEQYHRPQPMMAENIVVENNRMEDVAVGVGFWRDPENTHWTNRYRNMRIVNNTIIDTDGPAIQIRKINEDEPSASLNIIEGNHIEGHGRGRKPGEALIPALRIENPELWKISTGDATTPVKVTDFRPAQKLVMPKTRVLRAKFPVIDTHTHINDAYKTGDELVPMDRLVRDMNRLNIKKIVILTGKWGDALQAVLDRTVKIHPHRFVVFTQVDWARASTFENKSNFAQAMVAQIKDSVKRGARGLKVLKDFGLEQRYKNGELIKVDDPAFDPIWQVCAQLGIPVSIHTGDPAAFFDEVNSHNEQLPSLSLFPAWSYADRAKTTSFEDLLAAQKAIFARNPKTKFVALHFANIPENLGYLGELLRAYPNVHTEFGARQADLGRQPLQAKRFFLEFQDRIMFGTDWGFREDQYRNYFRWLETSDEQFAYWDWPWNGAWRISGLALPDKVLRKVYSENFEKLLQKAPH